MSEAKSLPALALRNANVRGEKPAMREKYHGIWQTYSWADYNAEVTRFAFGLKAMGFKAGDKLAIIGDNRPRLYWGQLAAQALGGCAVPVYQDSIADELAYVLADAEVSIILAENQEQIDKSMSIRDKLPLLTAMIYDDDRGFSEYSDPMLHSYDSVLEKGADGDAAAYAAAVETIDGDDIALMCYTSGTTGRPKGVMLSHANFIATAQTFIDNEDVRETDDFLSYLPMAWVGEVTYSVAVSLLTGATCNCPEGPETLQRDLRELGPTGLIATPRAWEAVLSEIQVKAGDITGIKKWCFETFRDAAISALQKKEAGESLGFGDRLKLAIGEIVIYSPVRDLYGFRRARWCYTGGAPLGPDTFRFFRAIGVNLKQVYGSTEISGLASMQRSESANPNSVGHTCDGIQVRIADSGEVQVQSPGVFKGYFKNEVATKEAFTEDGWFKTGDAGVMDSDGQLTIIDRAKDVGMLNDGSAFAPQFVENKLKYSAYISEAISFGHERPFVSAMVAIDMNTVGKWAERQALPYTNYMDLSQKSEIRTLISGEVDAINRTLPEALKIKRFLLLGKDLDADDAEITRTRKLRRSFIAEQYAGVIDALYNDSNEVDLRAEVTFEDGRRSHVDMRLTIQNAA